MTLEQIYQTLKKLSPEQRQQEAVWIENMHDEALWARPIRISTAEVTFMLDEDTHETTTNQTREDLLRDGRHPSDIIIAKTEFYFTLDYS